MGTALLDGVTVCDYSRSHRQLDCNKFSEFGVFSGIYATHRINGNTVENKLLLGVIRWASPRSLYTSLLYGVVRPDI